MNTSNKLLLGLALAGAAVLSCSADPQAPVSTPSREPVATPRGGWTPQGPEAGRAHPHLACSYERGELGDRDLAGMREALADEWANEAEYDALANRFGRPFPRLERSESRHADALVRLFDAHGHLPPPKPFENPVVAATDPLQACALALATERANVDMYDRLIAAGPPDDLKCVYEHLRSMSADRHIPALERCATRAR